VPLASSEMIGSDAGIKGENASGIAGEKTAIATHP
jgi:hypothetical protein